MALEKITGDAEKQFNLALNFLRGSLDNESSLVDQITRCEFECAESLRVKDGALNKYAAFLTTYSKSLATRMKSIDSETFYASYSLSEVDFINNFVSKLLKIVYAKKYPEDIVL